MPFGRGRMSSVVDDEIKNKELSKLEAIETQEWLDSLDHILQQGGPGRVRRLLRQLQIHAQEAGVKLPFTANTPYINTIPAEEQPPFPGSREIERRIKSIIRWNAMAMVVRANRLEEGIGGHISTYASAATLYEIGFNYFFRARTEDQEGDIIYFQGHASPGIYARAFLEGRLSVEQLQNFRNELHTSTFVTNCNGQSFEGGVRGNGIIIQELEAIFGGAGWNVIKVIWGDDWDPLLAKDHDGILVKVMEENVDGQYQKYIVETGKYIRERFFGADPRLLEMVKHLSDEQLQKLNRGGHDPEKVYAAYKAAVEHKGSPTVILAKTIKGYGLGESGEGKNITHQQKKLNEEEL